MYNNEKTQKIIARKVVNLINNQGATWESLEKVFGKRRVTLQRYLRAHYGLPEKVPAKELKGSQKHNRTVYDHLLEKAAANAVAESQAKKTVQQDEISKEVIVTETGYLMSVGYDTLHNTAEIFVPQFCFHELQNLSWRCSEADNVLKLIQKGNSNITLIRLTKEQELDLLIKEPAPSMKARVRGIAALCSELFFQGFRVHLFTTSKDAQQVVLDQGFGDAVKVTYVAQAS